MLIKTGYLWSGWWQAYFRFLSAIFQGKWSDTFPSCVFFPRTGAELFALLFKYTQVINNSFVNYVTQKERLNLNVKGGLKCFVLRVDEPSYMESVRKVMAVGRSRN